MDGWGPSYFPSWAEAFAPARLPAICTAASKLSARPAHTFRHHGGSIIPLVSMSSSGAWGETVHGSGGVRGGVSQLLAYEVHKTITAPLRTMLRCTSALLVRREVQSTRDL